MEAAADGWFIGHLRGRTRRHRLEEHLLDRRLRSLDIHALGEHLDALESEIAQLKATLSRADEPERPPGHVLFFPTPDGYAIVEADEPPPPAGTLLQIEGSWFSAERIGRSPFPQDRRPCLFLAHVPSGISEAESTSTSSADPAHSRQ
jgi:hypothetical protein